MTQETNQPPETSVELVVLKQLWDGVQMQKVGQTFAPQGISANQIQKFKDVGYLGTRDQVEQARNPEAFGARTELQASQARVAELEAQLAAQPAPPADTDVSALLAAFADENGTPASVADALEAIKSLRKDAARADQYARLTAVDGGTELASNFVARGKFAALGLTTYESLRGKSAGQLDAVEGVTPEQAAKAAELVEAHFAKTE